MLAATDAEGLFQAELRRATARVIDQTLFGVLGIGGSPEGLQSTDDPLADLAVLLAAVNTTGKGRLYWALNVGLANRAAVARDSAGARLFPDMTPLGGSMLGLPALVTEALPAGALVLLDASGVIGNMGAISVDIARQASLALADDAVISVVGTPDAVNLTSLWQTNSVAIRLLATFGVEVGRPGAVAWIEDATWPDAP